LPPLNATREAAERIDSMDRITQTKKKHKYTREDSKALDREILTPAIVAQVVGCAPITYGFKPESTWTRWASSLACRALGRVSQGGPLSNGWRRAFVHNHTHRAKEGISRTQCDPFCNLCTIRRRNGENSV
jgi:hypothetical protein